jgi:hypothetical protein
MEFAHVVNSLHGRDIAVAKYCSCRNCSITPGNSAWIAERAGSRRYDFVDNAQHFQVIPTKVGIQMFFFGVRLPSVIEQLLHAYPT